MAAEKKSVRYVGAHSEVEVLDDEGTIHVVKRGASKTVPAPLADSLLEQRENWAKGSAPASDSKGGD